MKDRWRMTLGDAIELCYYDALDDWRRLYARSTGIEELLAGPLRKVEVRVNVSHGGRASVTVACIGRRHLQDEAYYTPLYRDAGLWMLGESSTTYSDL
jgi:hypothetical protein